jgi:hypothetical protein
MGNQNNIIVGPASLSIGGIDVGFTQGGISLRKQTEFVDVDADQLGGVARKVATFERMFLTTTLLEVTRSNMQQLMNEPASNLDGTSLAFGTGDPAATEYSLTVTGDAPSSGTRTYTFYRAVAVDEIEHLIGSRDNPSVLPVGFELLKDPSNGDRFGAYIDT